MKTDDVTRFFNMFDKAIRCFLSNKRCCTAEVVEDITQNIYIKLVTKYNETNVNLAVTESLRNNKMAPYIYRTINNEHIDHHRKSKDKFHVDSSEPDFEETGGFGLENYEPAVDGNASDCVKIGFAEFKKKHPKCATALELAAIQGWSMKELAPYLDRTEGATREHLRQCRKALRPYIEHCNDYL